jgi:hypothetical protein
MRLGVMILLLLSGVNAMAQRNKVTIPAIRVIDKPEIEWISYPKDTVNLVGTNLQTFSVKIKSRLTLGQLILNINGIISDRYESIDFAPAIAENQYEQIIERTVALRTGLNNISIIVINEENIKVESNRRVMVDPSQIALLRTDKDQSAPMIYISNPSNISKTDRVTIYADILRLSGTVIDESGIQQLKVNGLIVPIKENGSYVINLPMNVGENPVAIEAKDLNQNISLKKFIVERKNQDGSVYDVGVAVNYLLVIGINNYSSWPELNNAVADADTIKKVLTSRYKFDEANVTILLNEEATRSNIYYKLRSYIEKITPKDNLMIYYSGHGYFDKLLSEGYWVPVEGLKGDESSYIPNSQVLKIIENINSQHTLLVADACFSGSLFASSTRGFSENVEKYKSRWGLASGRLEVVSDGEQGTNSPFSKGIIEFLMTNQSNKVPISDMVQFVKKKVAETSDQTPVGNPLKVAGDEGGEFIFYKR